MYKNKICDLIYRRCRILQLRRYKSVTSKTVVMHRNVDRKHGKLISRLISVLVINKGVEYLECIKNSRRVDNSPGESATGLQAVLRTPTTEKQFIQLNESTQ